MQHLKLLTTVCIPQTTTFISQMPTAIQTSWQTMQLSLHYSKCKQAFFGVYYCITISCSMSNYGFLYSLEILVCTVVKDLVSESAKVLIFQMEFLDTSALCYLFSGSLQLRSKLGAFGIELVDENYLSPSFPTGYSSVYCVFFHLGKPVMIITEYMENGSLDAFLRVGNYDRIN